MPDAHEIFGKLSETCNRKRRRTHPAIGEQLLFVVVSGVAPTESDFAVRKGNKRWLETATRWV